MRFKLDTGSNHRAYTGFMLLLLIVSLLVLPGCHRHSRPPEPARTQATIVKRQLDSEGYYYVRSGDTLWAIAFSYGLDPMDVAQKNGIPSPYTIYPGQKIHLMSPGDSASGSTGSSGVQITALKTPGQVTTKTVQSTAPSVTGSTPQNDAETAMPAPSAAPSADTATPAPAVSSQADPDSWRWPTEGRVIRGFVAGDPARNGLDIAGKEGQDITASSGGQVVYSGNGLIGYGELIIVKHSEKMLSAYAHNRVRLVKEGDQVWAGQKIAEMGRNSSDEQLLHFEIRALGKPVNPMTYLPAR